MPTPQPFQWGVEHTCEDSSMILVGLLLRFARF